VRFGVRFGVRFWVRFAPHRLVPRVAADLKSSIREPQTLTLVNMTTPPSTRPTFEELYMTLAFGMAQRSTCIRLKVGTVITSTDYRQVLAVGYNGNASGLANHCDQNVPGSCGCLHSEENACINCQSPRDVGKMVFVTHLPCFMCAKRLINLGGVRRVLYGEDYRRRESLDLLRSTGIEIAQFETPAKDLMQSVAWSELLPTAVS
jgi:dCMP deaminase